MLIRLIAFTFLEEKTHLALLSQITSTSKVKFSLSDKLVSQDKSQEESLKWTQILKNAPSADRGLGLNKSFRYI